MEYCETAVEIEREVKQFNEAIAVNRFIILCIWYHVDYCKRSPCSNCKFIKDFKDIFCLISTEIVLLKLYPIFKITVGRIIISFTFYLNY